MLQIQGIVHFRSSDFSPGVLVNINVSWFYCKRYLLCTRVGHCHERSGNMKFGWALLGAIHCLRRFKRAGRRRNVFGVTDRELRKEAIHQRRERNCEYSRDRAADKVPPNGVSTGSACTSDANEPHY